MLKEIVVISGKGGTGKTSIVASFAVLAGKAVLADCDVDAADLHLLLEPRLKEKNEFWSGHSAWIDSAKCTKCGLCEKLCRFKAISDNRISEISCEGCGFCSQICPVTAITMKDNLAGQWFISDTDYGPLVHARLGIAQENSGKLVTLVRQKAKETAEKNAVELIISDGPPGIGCPVISSLSGATLALLITEPSMSGIHDLTRVLDVCKHFNIPGMVCINKFDINPDVSRQIEKYCQNIDVIMTAKIPFDEAINQALVNSQPAVKYCTANSVKQIEMVWHDVTNYLNKIEEKNNAHIRI